MLSLVTTGRADQEVNPGKVRTGPTPVDVVACTSAALSLTVKPYGPYGDSESQKDEFGNVSFHMLHPKMHTFCSFDCSACLLVAFCTRWLHPNIDKHSCPWLCEEDTFTCSTESSNGAPRRGCGTTEQYYRLSHTSYIAFTVPIILKHKQPIGSKMPRALRGPGLHPFKASTVKPKSKQSPSDKAIKSRTFNL